MRPPRTRSSHSARTRGTTSRWSALQQSHSDWTRYGGRGDEGSAQWTPLGPTYAKGLPNPYRDRSVYTAGTANFSGARRLRGDRPELRLEGSR